MTKNTDKAIKFWLRCAKDNFETAKDMLEVGRYSFTMFMCQQTIEALLKAIVIMQTNERPPYIHQLGILLKATDLKIPKKILESVKEIDKHYIMTRYKPDRFNSKIYNKENADSLIKETQKVLQWFTRKLNLTI